MKPGQVRIWNNQECKLTQGKSGNSFDAILYWTKAGDIMIDAEGYCFQCTHAQLQNGTQYNWYVCFNPIRENKTIDTTKETLEYARYTNENNWTKSLRPNWYENLPDYPFDY